MPLHAAKTKWIESFAGVVTETAIFESNESNRVDAIASVSATLDQWKDEIARDQQYAITLPDDSAAAKLKAFFSGKAQTKSMSSVDAGGDAMEEVDTWADMPGMQAMEPAQVEKIMIAQARIVAMQEQMLSKVDANGERLFTDQDIMEELWTPLVREGVIPENAVPDRYSKVKSTFDGANEFYAERLADFSAEQTDESELLAKLGKAKKFAELGAKVATNVAGAVAGLQGEEVQKVTKLTTTLVDLTLSGTFSVAESAIKRDAEGAIDAMTDMVSGTIAAAYPKNPVAQIVSRSLKATVNLGKVSSHLANGDVDGALDALAGYFENAFALADGAGPDGIGSEIGAWSAFAVKQIRNSKSIHEAMTAPGGPDKAKLLAAFGKMGEQIRERVQSTDHAKSGPAEETEEQKKARKKKQAAEVKKATEIIKNSGALGKSLLDLGNDDDTPEIRAMKTRLAAMEIEAARDELEESRVEFQMMLANGFAIPTDNAEEESQAARQSVDSIEALILQMQKDRAIIATIESLTSAGINIATQIIPAFGAVNAAIEFSKRAVAAAMRARELNEWLANLEDASTASSVYAEAIRNRVHNSKVQLSKDVIDAVFELAKLIGAVGSCSGLAAPIGQAIEKGATAGAAAAELIYEVHKEAELAAAWKTYQQALRTPGNRKVLRKSMRDNPTLAKYVMAYGAIVEQDAIAIEVMNRCGLNDKVLKNPKSNAHKVVQYMELKFADDPVLERCIPNPEKWHPGPAELTLRSFMLFEAAAPELAPGQGGAVEGMLSQFVGLDSTATVADATADLAALEAQRTAHDDLLDVIEQLRAALDGYRPVTTERKPHVAMREYVESLAAQAETRARKVREQRQDIVRRIEAKQLEAQQPANTAA